MNSGTCSQMTTSCKCAINPVLLDLACSRHLLFTRHSSHFARLFASLHHNPNAWNRLCLTTFCDSSKKPAPPTQLIRCKTKTNHVLVTRVFPHLAPVTCICFEISLVHCDVSVFLLWSSHCNCSVWIWLYVWFDPCLAFCARDKLLTALRFEFILPLSCRPPYNCVLVFKASQ